MASGITRPGFWQSFRIFFRMTGFIIIISIPEMVIKKLS